MTVIPDSIEPVEHWRTWNFDGRALVSHNGETWKPNEAMAAACKNGGGAIRQWTVVRSGWDLEQAGRVARAHNESQSFASQMAFSSRVSVLPRYVSHPTVEPPDGYGYALETVQHDTPAADCTCGIYAGSELADCPPGDIAGRVKMWGTVIPGERGTRAQYAYPSELHVPAKYAEHPALLAYGVPIIVADTPTTLAALAPAPSLNGTRRVMWIATALNVGALTFNLSTHWL